MSLKEVKTKIVAVKKIHQVTKAMEAVSAVKMRRSQESAIETRPFALHAMGLLRRLVQRNVTKEHDLVKKHRAVNNILFIIITSDRGLAGALNAYVIKAALKYMKEKHWKKKQVSILAIGKKGYEYFEKHGYTVVDHLEKWGEGVAFGDPSQLTDKLITEYREGKYDRVMVAYSNFESTFSQNPVVRRLLPVSFAALEEVIDSIAPERGKYSELHDIAKVELAGEYTFEPDEVSVLDALLPYLVGVLLYHAVLEANASEHSARMVAMKGASDKARDLTKELTLKFNKERQTSITAEVSEITSGIEATS